MTPLISIITPCYNQGNYIDDAIESVSSIKTNYAFEHIIINDGSTEESTIRKLTQLENKGHRVIHQQNKGLATARNIGISHALGKYIIPLDADNKLCTPYLTTAVKILEVNHEVDVVFGDSIFFGNQDVINRVKHFDINQMLQINYIDACAVIRRTAIENVGGFDVSMPGKGHEDWDLWLNIFFKGGNFYYLQTICFFYRVTKDSMRLNVSAHTLDIDRDYIIKKHSNFFLEFFKDNFWKIQYLSNHKIKGSFSILRGNLFNNL